MAGAGPFGDPNTARFLSSSLASGSPVTELSRGGLIPNLLRGIGAVDSKITASPEQQLLVQEALRQRHASDMMEQFQGAKNVLEMATMFKPEARAKFVEGIKRASPALFKPGTLLSDMEPTQWGAIETPTDVKKYIGERLDTFRTEQLSFREQLAILAQQNREAALAQREREIDIKERTQREKATGKEKQSVLYKDYITQKLNIVKAGMAGPATYEKFKQFTAYANQMLDAGYTLEESRSAIEAKFPEFSGAPVVPAETGGGIGAWLGGFLSSGKPRGPTIRSPMGGPPVSGLRRPF